MVRETLGNRNAIVVAHPDDEALWAGGLLARFSDREWTVIACSTPVDDPKREDRFYASCREMGAHPVLLPIPDCGTATPLDGLEVLDALLEGFDCVVTHGSDGEYGHLHHRQVHEWVRDHYPGPVITFGWSPRGEGEYRIELTQAERQAKDRALRCYDHIYDSLVSAYFGRYGVPRTYETYDVR